MTELNNLFQKLPKQFPKKKPCTVKDQVLSYSMLANVQILVKTTDSGGYFGSTVGGGYVAKPTLSRRLYNSETQGFS